NIYKRMEQAGIVMCVAAGNEYSMAEFSSVGYIGTEYTDFGTIASPAAYDGNISVAAVQNSNYPIYMLSFNGKKFSFVDTCQDGSHGWMQTFMGKSTSVVVLKNSAGTDLALGTASDFSSVNVKGKIVVVSRGELSFQEKMDNAANAGAVGVIVVNSEEGTISMSIDPYAIPAVSVAMSLKDTFLSASSSAKLSTPSEMTFIENSKAYLMCDFSNWGPTPMLTIDPTISSIGGNVYSAVPDSDTAYQVMSGTSMACPNATGTFACLLEAVRSAGKASNTSGSRKTLTKIESMERAVDLMESTGLILRDADDYIYSVRRQGSGLANSSNSLNTYLEGAYISNPIRELGDDKNKTGVYTMDLTLVNDGYEEITYNDFNTYILRDQVGGSATGYVNLRYTDHLYEGKSGSATVTYKVSGKEVTSLTLKPSESKTVTVTITLAKDAKEYYDTYFPNGAYVEGFVSFSNATGSVETHATFLAYYGDWLRASAMESISTFEYLQAAYALNNEIYANGKTYAEAGYTLGDVLIEKFGSYYTDMNVIYTADSDGEANNYLGANLMDIGNTPYRAAYHAFSTPSTNAAANDAVSILFYPRLLRNARSVKMTVRDKNTGTIYHSEQYDYVAKGRYDTENAVWNPTVGFDWDGTKSDGKNYVSSGTVATVSLDILLPYGESAGQWQTNAYTFDVTVDYTAPVIKSAVYDASKQLVSVTASDSQYLASIILCSSDYKTLHATKTFAPSATGESCTAVFDVSSITDKNLVAVVFDYATNQVSKTVTSGTVTTDPTDPTTPTEPTEPTDPTEPTTPTEPSTPAEPTTETYKLVTSVSDLTDGEYLIMTTATGSYKGNYGYYIMTTTKDGTYAAMQSSGQNFDSLPGGLKLNTSAKSKYVWTVTGNANGFTLKTSAGTYLTGVSGKTSLSLTDSGSTWKGSYTSSKNGFLLSANSRYLAFRDDIETVGSNNNPLFVTNSSSSGVTVYMHLYKKQVTATCSHSNTTTSTTPATCTTDGKTVVTCKDCGATVSTTVIPATGHNTATTTIDPTCTETGAVVEYCKTCDTTLNTTVIPATGHNTATTTIDPTCTETGAVVEYCKTCD
ncbi:MAG: S8 family serine peptidase, partial [Oscillospiraceae bacterium]|nr:S8 family serine peptidase [Oscillospiraceae bacterium]